MHSLRIPNCLGSVHILFMDDDSKEKYLTVRDVARHFCLSETTIRRHILNQEIPFHKIMGAIRFRLSEIESWVESRKKENGEAGGEEQSRDLFTGIEAETRGKE